MPFSAFERTTHSSNSRPPAGSRSTAKRPCLTGPKVSFPGASTQGIRPVKQIDEHDLFRIYNASTPSRARLSLGMTVDQWRAAREPVGWRSREYICRQDDTTRGWVQITRRPPRPLSDRHPVESSRAPTTPFPALVTARDVPLMGSQELVRSSGRPPGSARISHEAARLSGGRSIRYHVEGDHQSSDHSRSKPGSPTRWPKPCGRSV